MILAEHRALEEGMLERVRQAERLSHVMESRTAALESEMEDLRQQVDIGIIYLNIERVKKDNFELYIYSLRYIYACMCKCITK